MIALPAVGTPVERTKFQVEERAEFRRHIHLAGAQWRRGDYETFIGREIDFAADERPLSRKPDARRLLPLTTSLVSAPGDTPALPERSHSGSAFRPSAESWRP
jgi:hypothetical protein